MAKSNSNGKNSQRMIAENRKARYHYEFEDIFEAGIVLVGTEVKSLRSGKANIAESYASVEDGELWLINSDIREYTQGNRHNHEPRRKRKLLIGKRQLNSLDQSISRRGMTLVPLKLYFNDRGLAKLALALAKGKNVHDKREDQKKRDWQKQKLRLLREKG